MIGEIVGDVIFELGVRGVGYLICRRFHRQIDPESLVVLLVGVLFWAGVAVAGYLIYAHRHHP